MNKLFELSPSPIKDAIPKNKGHPRKKGISGVEKKIRRSKGYSIGKKGVYKSKLITQYGIRSGMIGIIYIIPLF